ncbi:hypothetical protein SEPCBS57363_001892 [Sporothrix epigloea]|uniref:Uncharacterized protein n=1 Tax=Sporothrix epigloea TaxID=1892477 RepID=A0ABP0DFV0_9PEZI
MSSNPSTDHFTGLVVDGMRKLYPEELADRTWDNVGLLVDNTHVPRHQERNRRNALLTIDLTPDVVDEAISYQASVIVAYHPIIFRGLKSITSKDTQQASLLRLMRNNIAVYCPHTALDAGVYGINDWLASCVREAARDLQCSIKDKVVVKSVIDELSYSKRQRDINGAEIDVGYGRITTLSGYVPAPDFIKLMVTSMGLSMSHVLVAPPRASTTENTDHDNTIRRVGVCPGSGFDVFRDNLKRIDILVTGEVSHHDALLATTNGVWVVCVLHSNSERRFLRERLQPQLTRELGDRDFVVIVSEADRDPFEFWDLDNPPTQTSRSVAVFAV